MNAAILAVQMLALSDAELAQKFDMTLQGRFEKQNRKSQRRAERSQIRL